MAKRIFNKGGRCEYPVTLTKIFVSFVFFIVAVLLISLKDYSDLKLVLFFGQMGAIGLIWMFDAIFWNYYREDGKVKPHNYHIKRILIFGSALCVTILVQQALYV